MSKSFEVIFTDADGAGKKRSARVEDGATVLDAARAAGVAIEATCGERGRCRSCRVKILRGTMPPPTVQDTVQLGPDAVQEQFRLSCQTAVIADCEIMAVPVRSEVGHQILSSDKGVDASAMVLDCGVTKHVINAKAPVEEHHQSSDLEEILTVLGSEYHQDVPLRVLRKIPDALRKKQGAITVTTFNHDLIDIEPGDTSQHKYGMAFDIGTTSIVGNLMDLDSGEQLAAVGSVNPQAIYGGDLMSRIAYAQFDEKKLTTLRAKALTAVNDFIKQACEAAQISSAHIYKVVLVGNTCMHHVFLGIDVSYVGLAPYAPTVRHSMTIPAQDLPLKGAPNAVVCLLPIVAGFVGADTMAATLATRVHESEGIRVMVDIGTNGEVVMGSRDRLMACSAPAGPALEGAQITHGMRGAVGAIEKVSIGEDVVCDVIGDAPALGICGSGLIDAVAKMLEAGVLDGAGRLRRKDMYELPRNVRKRIVGEDKAREFVLSWAEQSGKGENISLTQLDIRQLQLAKGAIYAGILMLQEVMKIADEDIEELLLCGGFGNYINIESAIGIRLLPALAVEKITYVGNAAHMGAQMALLSETERLKADDIAERVEHVALATRPEFQLIFVDAMSLSDDPSLKLSVSGA